VGALADGGHRLRWLKSAELFFSPLIASLTLESFSFFETKVGKGLLDNTE